jgi:transcription elongation factor Elf1
MWLSRIEPDEPNHDRRTFECLQCDQSHTEVVNTLKIKNSKAPAATRAVDGTF